MMVGEIRSRFSGHWRGVLEPARRICRSLVTCSRHCSGCFGQAIRCRQERFRPRLQPGELTCREDLLGRKLINRRFHGKTTCSPLSPCSNPNQQSSTSFTPNQKPQIRNGGSNVSPNPPPLLSTVNPCPRLGAVFEMPS